MTGGDLQRLAVISVISPKTGARVLLDLGLPNPVRWLALSLLAVLLTLIGAGGELLAAPPESGDAVSPGYLGVAVIHAVLLILPAALIHVIGERTGGQATFPDAVLIVVWLQFLLLPVQVAATLAQALIPSLSGAVLMTLAVATFWLLTNFVAELHGYRSRLNVFLGILTVSVVFTIFLLPFLDPSFS
jgi:hypothetical protein